MRTGRRMHLRLLTLALALAGALTLAMPARPASAAPTCYSSADQPFVSGSLVVGRHLIRCTAVMGSITVIGRLYWNGGLITSQTGTCTNVSYCYLYTRYPIRSGTWQAFTSGNTAGPVVPVPVAASPLLNVP